MFSHKVRAIASLTFSGGQGKNISSISPFFPHFSSIFLNLLPHFGPPGGWVAHLGRPWLCHCTRSNFSSPFVNLSSSFLLDTISQTFSAFSHIYSWHQVSLCLGNTKSISLSGASMSPTTQIPTSFLCNSTFFLMTSVSSFNLMLASSFSSLSLLSRPQISFFWKAGP